MNIEQQIEEIAQREWKKYTSKDITLNEKLKEVGWYFYHKAFMRHYEINQDWKSIATKLRNEVQWARERTYEHPANRERADELLQEYEEAIKNETNGTETT